MDWLQLNQDDGLLTTVLLLVIVVAIVSAISYLLHRLTLQKRIQQATNELTAKYQQEKQFLDDQLSQTQQQLTEARHQQALLMEKLESQRQLAQTEKQNAQQHNEQQLRQMQQQLHSQFENLANRIFESREKHFSQQNKQALDGTLKPLQEQLEQFRKRVDDVHSKDISDRSQLRTYIEQLQKKTEQMSNDALNLSKALKGDNKLQGNWGEMILEKLLEESGLVKGVEYSTQHSYQDDNNRRFQPDVIIHLPENKSLIIDSKVSLVHYERYHNNEDTSIREQSLKLHIQSIREQIKDLSRKQYEGLEQLQTIDFVFMFIPIEPAYLLALQHQPQLFTEAFEQNVTLVSHTTLMPLLRTVNMLWRTEKQNRYALDIANQAGKLYDKFVLMLKAFDDVGSQLGKTQKAYDETRKRFSEGRGNLLSQTEKLKKMGVNTQNQLPESFQKELEVE